MVRKSWLAALVLFLLIPLVSRVGRLAFTWFDPESALGHPNYASNYHRLYLLRNLSFWISLAVMFLLWLAVCRLAIRSKKRSGLWLFLAALGPIGFAILSMLDDKTPAQTDRYTRFQRNLRWPMRVVYELSLLVIVWMLAYQAMVFRSELMIRQEALRTGVSTAQIMQIRDASSGMWAFSEGNEVMYLVILLYLVWPVLFSTVGQVFSRRTSPRPA